MVRYTRITSLEMNHLFWSRRSSVQVLALTNSRQVDQLTEKSDFFWQRQKSLRADNVNLLLPFHTIDFFEKNSSAVASASGWQGVDVMITIFCDFRPFSAKKLAFFSKTNVMMKILHNSALFWVKNANFFADFFGENIEKNHNIGPW
jgi:hypothetical protein